MSQYISCNTELFFCSWDHVFFDIIQCHLTNSTKCKNRFGMHEQGLVCELLCQMEMVETDGA